VPHGSSQKKDYGQSILFGVVLALLLLLVSFGALSSIGKAPYAKSIVWAAIASVMVFSFLVIGKAIKDRWDGILIDERNVMTLSRFQIIIWTIIILSAYFTIAGAGIYAGKEDPLNVNIDWRLWALMGISSTSFVATPLILESKKRKTIDDEIEYKKLEDIKSRQPSGSFSEQRTSPSNARDELLKLDVQKIDNTNVDAILTKAKEEVKAELKNNRVEGILFANIQATEAKFSDIFEGDEVGNESHVDVSKVQMFFFTIISALSYVVMLAVMFADASVPEKLPILPEGLIAILTISHGAYLTNKTVDHTATTRKS
jgi:hypothetical protein